MIVAHDAGGAEIVSSWVKKQKNDNFYYCVAGPAIKIFSKKIPNFVNYKIEDMENLLSKSDVLLMATSWKSDFERIFLKNAKKLNKRTIAFLDHWVNYEVRFKFQERILLPDELWVGDEHAYKIACQKFPDSKIKLILNPYINEMVTRAKKIKQVEYVPPPSSSLIKILYLCEPVSDLYGYHEYDALKNYLRHLIKDNFQNFEIKLRLHPSEEIAKYSVIINLFRNKLKIYQSLEDDLLVDCLEADWVVGCETMAMVVALHLGKKVFSCIPLEGKPCSLPFPEITRLFNHGIVGLPANNIER